MILLPSQRVHEIQQRLSMLAAADVLHATFIPSAETDEMRYFPEELADDLARLDTARLQVHYRSHAATADVILTTAHGANNAEWLWQLREANPRALLAVWLWDNHLAHGQNLATVLPADLYFPSHAYLTSYLVNPCSASAGIIPAACAQWSAAHLRAALARAPGQRQPAVYASFVDYDMTPRRRFLEEAQARIPALAVRFLPRKDRSPYFAQSPARRMEEWLNYTASLVIPVHRDLSTRFFDGLAAGHVVVISDAVTDLDQVVSPAEQAALPVIKFHHDDVDSLREAVELALAAAARDGEAGVQRRQTFVGTKHLLAHRVKKMLLISQLAIEGRLSPAWHREPLEPSGLLLRSSAA